MASRIASCRSFVVFADEFVRAARTLTDRSELKLLMEAVTRELHFRHYALIHHGELGGSRSDLVDLKDYPETIVEELFGQGRFRRDPVIRGCLFSGSAFAWSELPQILQLSRYDRASLQNGARAGLNDGITVPYVRLGDPMGSCTFAGTRQPQLVHSHVGVAQMVGIFAFQAARRFVAAHQEPVPYSAKLHPRPRDCVILAGRGYSNKQIARALSLAPRTVDGYLTEARRLLAAHDRTELVISALLAGEIDLSEIVSRQPG